MCVCVHACVRLCVHVCVCMCILKGFLAYGICFFAFFAQILTTAIEPPSPLHPHATTTTTDYHYTVQVAQVQVEYMWAEGKRPPAQVTMGDTSTGARSVCANG